jgi:hypothetical protein
MLLQTGGYYVVFYADIMEAKRESSEYINGFNKDDDKVTSLTFALKDGKIIASNLIFNDDDEFTYQGKMYDVISTEKGNGTITFKCYTDDKETELNQNLCDKIDSDKDTPAQKQRNNLFVKLLTQHFTLNVGQAYCFTTNISTTYYYNYQNDQQPSIYSAVVSPPPELGSRIA